MVGNAMTDDIQVRQQLVEIGRRLWQRGLVSANDGNLSVRLGPESLLCTPSGVSKGFLKGEDLVVTDLDGIPVSKDAKPSSELKMHVAIYQQRTDVRAVVHAHPPHATAFALLGRSLPRHIMPEMEVLLGLVPVIPYRTPGTQEFADAFHEHVADCDAFILSNHGATTVGRSIEEAWFRMESLDQSCRILLLAMQAGTLQEIPTELRELLEQQRKACRA